MATAMADEAPPYSFVAKNGSVSWNAVMGFDLSPFLGGQNVAPYALNALDDLSRQLEEARIEPEQGADPSEMADRLARLAVVLQLSSEYQAMRAEDLQASVEKKDQELDAMDEQLEQLERGGARSDDSLEREADAARSRAEEAERRMNLQTQELEALKEQLERHISETRESKRALDEARVRANRAEDDVKEMQERLANETRKMQAKMREDTTAAQRASQRNQEVARYQKENQLLAEENDKLSGKIQELMAECVGYSETIVRLDDAAQGWRGKEADVEAAAESLRRERDQLHAQLETTQNDLDDRTAMLQTFEQRFSEEHELWRQEKEELEEETRRLTAAVSMERERGASGGGAAGGSPGANVSSLASPRRRANVSGARGGTHTGANGLHPDDPRYVEELEAEVKELRDLRVLLLEAYDQLEKDVGREIDIALQRQNRHHSNLEAKVSVQDEALRQEQKRFKNLDRALQEAQDELADMQKRNASYEQGVYGLSEAMRDLKGLRLQLRAADQQVQDAVDVSNELGRKVEDLTEETRFLRQKAGIPEDATIDLGDFKLRSKVEAAQLRALNTQLEHEVQELEEDRRRLRNELRYRAKWQGEHAAKLGLSARQLAMLEEFADSLRFGQETSFQVEGDEFSAQRAVEHINARAVKELEEANRHLQERLAETLERAQMQGVAVSVPASGAVSARAPAQEPSYAPQPPQQQYQAPPKQAYQQPLIEPPIPPPPPTDGRNDSDNVAAAAAILALQQQQYQAQQEAYQKQQEQFQQQMFQQQQAQLQQTLQQQQEQLQRSQSQSRDASQPTVIHERTHERVIERGETDAASAAQIAELQRQLQKARSEIVRLEDGYHDAMTRSSQNFQSASTAAATQAAAMAAATQAAAFAAMTQISRPSTPPPEPSPEPSRPQSPSVPSLSDAIKRSADAMLSKQRMRLQERLAEVERVKADSEAAAKRAAEDAEAAKKRADMITDAASLEANAAAVAATAAALAEAQRVAATAAAAADSMTSQFEQARAKEFQAGRAAAEKAEETRVAQLEADAALRRAEDEARSAARRAEEEAHAAARQAEEDARYARNQARSRAEDERIARNAALAEEAQRAFAAQAQAAAEALAEAQRIAMAATNAAKSAERQLAEARAREAKVPAPLPPALAAPAPALPAPVPPAVAPAVVPTASIATPPAPAAPAAPPAPLESETTTTTTVVETINAPTAAAVVPAPALAAPLIAAPTVQPPVSESPTKVVYVNAPQPPTSPRVSAGSQTIDLPVPQPPASPRRSSGSQTAVLPPAAPAAMPAQAVPAPAMPAPAAPRPAYVPPPPVEEEEDMVAASDYMDAITAVERLRTERDELRVKLRKAKSTLASDEREIYELKQAVHQLGEQAQMAHHQMQAQAQQIDDMSQAMTRSSSQQLMPSPPSSGQLDTQAMEQQQQQIVELQRQLQQARLQQQPSIAMFDVPAIMSTLPADASSARLREECAAADRALAVLAADLQSKERELEQLASEVSRYDAAMREMGSTRASLYREHVRAAAVWNEEREQLTERLQRAETEAEACKVSEKDARSLVERLKPGAESGLKEALAAAHARLAVLQARETRLSRSLESATQKELRSQKEKAALDFDIKEMSKAVRERLVFHEQRADEAEAKAFRARRELEMCVPRDEHARVVTEAKALQHRHKELLESRLESSIAATKLAAAEEDAAAAKVEAETAVAAAHFAEARAASFENALEKCLEDATHPKQLDAVALRRTAAELEAKLESATRAEALAKREAERQEVATKDAKKDVAALETTLSAAKANLHLAREAERARVQELASRASEQKTRADEDALAAATEEAAVARAEARRAEERALTAEQALAEKQRLAEAEKAELVSLRSAAKDMERRSDAAAALARANDELLKSKGVEASLKHRADVAEAEADRLHKTALTLHARLQVQDRKLTAVRDEARTLAAAQEGSIASVQQTLDPVIDAKKAKEWERALHNLKSGSERREKVLDDALAASREALERAETAETRLASLRDAEQRRNAEQAARPQSGESDADEERDVLLREMRRLGEEALTLKLEASRALRAERAAAERVQYLQNVANERELRCVSLEENAAREKLARDQERDEASRKLRAARRDALDAAARADAHAKEHAKDNAMSLRDASVGEALVSAAEALPPLPAPPAPRRKPDPEALAAVGAAAVVGVTPDAASPEIQRVVLQQIEAIRALKIRAADAEAAAASATREAAHALATQKHAEEERDAVMQRLEKQVASSSRTGGGVATAGEESAVAQVTAVAQSTIARLQDLVADKNRALTRAQQAMTDLRADAIEKQGEDRQTIEELNELLFKQNQRDIQNMRDAVEFGEDVRGVSGGDAGASKSVKLTGRYADKSRQDLLDLLDKSEVAVEALTMKYEQQRARHESAEQRLAEEADLRVGEANRSIAEARSTVKGSQSSRVLETLVARLKSQLASKDKRIQQLKDSIRELEKKLGDAYTQSSDVSSKAASTVSERAVVKAGVENKATVLAAKLKRTQDALSRYEQKEQDWAEEKRAFLSEKRAAQRNSSSVTSRPLSSRAVASPRDTVEAEEHMAQLLVERERCDELENRVKVLTAQNGKLDWLLKAKKEEEQNEKTLQTRTRGGTQTSGDENEIDSSPEDPGTKARRAETLQRWEEGVKLRKRGELLAKKLTAKTKELEECQKLVERSRVSVAELSREKSSLTLKLQKATQSAAEKDASTDKPDPDATRKLHMECEALHRELQSTRRVVDVEQAGEIARLQRRCTELEEQSQSAGPSTKPEKSTMETKLAILESDVLSRDDQALGLRFEAEQATTRAERLQRRLDDLFRGGGNNGGSSSGRDASSRRAQELEDVVGALKKVVEKQQSELAASRARLATAAKGADAARLAKQLKQKVRDLETEAVELRRVETERDELLRKIKDHERAAKSSRLGDASALVAQAQAEAADTALQLAETRDALVASENALEAARQDAVRARRLTGVSGSGGGDSVRIENLLAENADLRAELDALDPAFFDEVMEMKRAYHDQTGVVERYEQMLRRYAAQLGESFEPESKK